MSLGLDCYVRKRRQWNRENSWESFNLIIRIGQRGGGREEAERGREGGESGRRSDLLRISGSGSRAEEQRKRSGRAKGWAAGRRNEDRGSNDGRRDAGPGNDGGRADERNRAGVMTDKRAGVLHRPQHGGVATSGMR